MAHIKTFLLFFIILYYTNLTVSDEVQLGICESTGRYGVCKVADECKYAEKLRKKTGVLSPIFLTYMRINFCGFDKFNPKICCIDTKAETPKYESVVHRKPSNINFQNSNKKITLANKNEKPKQVQIEKQQSLLPEKCGSEFGKRIIGGGSVQLNEFSWLALLEYEKSTEIILGCGGSLISKRYVLTAGHCVSSIPQKWKLKRVRLGEYDTQSELDCEPEGDDNLKCTQQVQKLSIEQEIVHENFWKPNDYANDIALLRLSQDVQFTDYIQPICLPKSSNLGDTYWAAGWGQTESNSHSTTKVKVSLPRFDFSKCMKTYATKNVSLGDGQMCAGGVSGKDTCAGDSGGPLVRLADGIWIIDGIISMGHRPCGANGWPAVYTKVFHYLPWILSKLQP